MSTSIRTLDPPMQFAPFPAGFPLSRESPRLLPVDGAVTDRSMRRAKMRELFEQEPRYESGTPPFPSGFPLPSDRSAAPLRTPGGGLSRIERKYLYEKLDPDIEISPSGFPEPLSTPTRTSERYAPATPEQVATGRSYLSQIAEKEARERLQRAAPKAAAVPTQVVEEIKTETKIWWKKTASALADAEREGFIVQKKLEEAAEKAALSNTAKYEADEARRLAEEAKSQAKDAPMQARVRVSQLKEALADAKAQVVEEIRELQAAQAELEKATYDKDNKAQEAKVVAKAAKSKRAELQELERMLSRIELLRQETADAERRAGQVAEEMKELVTQLSRKQKSMDDKSTELITLRQQVNDLAQQYAAAVSEHETSGAVVQRNVKVAEALTEEAQLKLREAQRLAQEWDAAKQEALAAAQREREILEKVREIGEEEGQQVVQDVTRRLPPPKITQAGPVDIYWSQGGEAGEPSSKPELTPRPLQDIESD